MFVKFARLDEDREIVFLDKVEYPPLLPEMHAIYYSSEADPMDMFYYVTGMSHDNTMAMIGYFDLDERAELKAGLLDMLGLVSLSEITDG